MNICIMGDSWGCGVWGQEENKNYGVIHKGLHHFLQLNHSVVNLSLGGNTNINAVKSLKNIPAPDFDFIFWFITDPLRDVEIEWFHKTSINYTELIQEKNRLLKKAYEGANQLNKTIHCIGGAGDLQIEIIKDYSNLIPYIPKLTQFLVPTFVHPEIWITYSWLKEVKKQFDPESLDKILENRKKQEKTYSIKEWFWPDGMHPNLKAHEILYYKICKDFKL